ncbi:MAG: calcineurin-like phosphoesterase, partial [Paenibacillus sp.]|nr:calcineurin-like phosphoesterase [Paenibacillus sp.]
RLMFASTEPQPKETCYQVQECYVTDAQFAVLQEGLEKRRGVPVIVFTHAPPICCGLRTVPDTHVRSTNAYLDQNHVPERWLELARHYPEIVMWFSGHYHLSHHHPDAHTIRYGTHFFLTGVHGDCTRDGRRQSRVIDIADDRVTVGTLDHDERKRIEEGAWHWPRPVASLMQHKLLRRVAACPVGEASVLGGSLVQLPGGRWVAASEDGFCWEVKPEWEAVMGSLHVGVKVHGIASGRSHLWSIWDDCVGASPHDRLSRFARLKSGGVPELRLRLETPLRTIAARGKDGAWAADDRALWRIDREQDESESGGDKLVSRELCLLPEPPRQLIADDDEVCWIIGAEGGLYRWDGARLHKDSRFFRVLAFDARDGIAIALIDKDGAWSWVRATESSIEYEEWSGAGAELSQVDAENGETAAILAVGRRCAILLMNGRLTMWTGPGGESFQLDTGAEAVAALAAASEEDAAGQAGVRFAFTTVGSEAVRSRLELWEFTENG